MKYTSPLISAGSGSLAGITFSHNKGGQYQRRRAIPVNPNTAFQVAIRGSLSNLAQAWSQVLTAAQRADWNLYAANVTTIDTLGNTITLTGLDWYIKVNTIRVQGGLTRLDAAPTIFTMAGLTNPGVASVTASTDIASITFTNTDLWATTTGGALNVFTSRPQNTSINYYKGPFRYAGSILGAVSAPTSPQPINLAFPCAVGQRIFVRFIAANADGRVSVPLITFRTSV